jgi:hypothetical protein
LQTPKVVLQLLLVHCPFRLQVPFAAFLAWQTPPPTPSQ